MHPERRAREEVADLMDRINRAWLDGRPRDLAPLFHERIVMALPGLAGRAEGREQVLVGFAEFAESARVVGWEESDRRVDVAGPAAVVAFSFELVYERGRLAYRSTGRDVWVFGREEEGWRAVWRTLLELTDEPLEES